MANNINSDYEYFNLVEDKVRGTSCPVYEYTASDGVTVEFSIMSIPDHIDKNTQIVFYYSGGGNYSRADYDAALQGLKESGECVALVIGGDVASPENNMRILEGIEKVLNIPSENYNSVAFSHASSIALKTAALLKKNNPYYDSGFLVFLDPNKIRVDTVDSYSNGMTYLERLKDLKFLVFNGGADAGRILMFRDNLNLTWINARSYYSKIHSDYKIWDPHQANNYYFFRDGGINDLFNGLSNFEYIYNINLEEYIRRNEPVMKALRKRKYKIEHFTPIKCDDEFVESETNSLINKVKSFEFFNSLDGNAGYGSTTEVPNIEVDYLNKKYDEVFDVLDKVLVSANNVRMISNSYTRLQNKQLNILNDMNNIERL